MNYFSLTLTAYHTAGCKSRYPNNLYLPRSFIGSGMLCMPLNNLLNLAKKVRCVLDGLNFPRPAYEISVNIRNILWKGHHASHTRSTFDPLFNFRPNVDSILTRAWSRINILRAFADTNWDQKKETILITYKSFIWTLFIYAVSIWFSNATSSSI